MRCTEAKQGLGSKDMRERWVPVFLAWMVAEGHSSDAAASCLGETQPSPIAWL